MLLHLAKSVLGDIVLLDSVDFSKPRCYIRQLSISLRKLLEVIHEHDDRERISGEP